MMMLVIFMFSLVFVQGASMHLEDSDERRMQGIIHEGEWNHQFLIERFGSMGASILSLFAAITGGNDWLGTYTAIELAGSLYSYLFLGFIGFCSSVSSGFSIVVPLRANTGAGPRQQQRFLLLNILTGIFVENALLQALPTKEQIAVQKHNEELAMTKELHRLISSFDEELSGRVCLDRFFSGTVGSPLHTYLHSIDVSVKELKEFVEFVGANKRGTISVTSLIRGCTLARGSARNFRLAARRFRCEAPQTWPGVDSPSVEW